MNVERLLNYIGQSKKGPINRLIKKSRYGEIYKKMRCWKHNIILFHTETKSIRRKKIFYW